MPKTFQNSKSQSLGLGLTQINRRIHHSRIVKGMAIGLSVSMMMKAADTLYLHGQIGLPEYQEQLSQVESAFDWFDKHSRLFPMSSLEGLEGLQHYEVQAYDALGNMIGPVVWMDKGVITLGKVPPEAVGFSFDQVRFMNEVSHVLH